MKHTPMGINRERNLERNTRNHVVIL